MSLECRLVTVPLIEAGLGWVTGGSKLPLAFRSPPSVFILGLSKLKQLLLNAFLCVGCKSMRINVETQDASLGFC